MNSNGHLFFIDSNSFELVETEYYYSVGDVVIVSVYNNGLFVGWRPFVQFDLSREMDSLHCIYINSYDCGRKDRRGMEFKAKIHFIHGSTWGMIQGWTR